LISFTAIAGPGAPRPRFELLRSDQDLTTAVNQQVLDSWTWDA
jgi:hypothetical protein